MPLRGRDYSSEGQQRGSNRSAFLEATWVPAQNRTCIFKLIQHFGEEHPGGTALFLAVQGCSAFAQTRHLRAKLRGLLGLFQHVVLFHQILPRAGQPAHRRLHPAIDQDLVSCARLGLRFCVAMLAKQGPAQLDSPDADIVVRWPLFLDVDANGLAKDRLGAGPFLPRLKSRVYPPVWRGMMVFLVRLRNA